MGVALFCVYACVDTSAHQARIVLSFGRQSVLTVLKFSELQSFACHIAFFATPLSCASFYGI